MDWRAVKREAKLLMFFVFIVALLLVGVFLVASGMSWGAGIITVAGIALWIWFLHILFE